MKDDLDQKETINLEASERVNPFHPGEILREEFLESCGMSQRDLAEKIDVYYPRINQIVNGKRGITPDTAARFARVFNTTAEFWLNLQHSYDLTELKKKDTWDEIQSIHSVI